MNTIDFTNVAPALGSNSDHWARQRAEREASDKNQPVDAIPCWKCGVRSDLHDEHGCKRFVAESRWTSHGSNSGGEAV